MTGKSDIGDMSNLPSHLSQPSRSGNRLFCSSYGQRGYPAISPRKIAILEQNQRRKRKIPSHTAPRARCPPCCRLWAALWPRRVEAGYGYHPAHLRACRGAFRCAESIAGERGGVVRAPPRTLLPTVRAVAPFHHRRRGRAFSAGGGVENRKSPAVAEQTAGSQQNSKEENENDN